MKFHLAFTLLFCYVIEARGPLIWQEEFDVLNTSRWSYMITGWRGGNSEFEYYANYPENRFEIFLIIQSFFNIKWPKYIVSYATEFYTSSQPKRISSGILCVKSFWLMNYLFHLINSINICYFLILDLSFITGHWIWHSWVVISILMDGIV